MSLRSVGRRRLQLGAMVAAVVLSTASPSAAAIIAAWDFTGTGNETSVAATTNAVGGTVEVTRGPGLNASSLANSFGSSSFTTGGTIGNAATNGDYLQFSLAVPTGSTLSLTDLDANFRRSPAGTGPNTFLWQYNVGSGFVDIGSSFNYTGTEDQGADQSDIILSGITALQNIAAETNVTFRLLGAGSTNAGQTFALGRLAGNDLELNGTLSPTAIPEPTSLVLCSAAALSMGGAAWRKRRARRAEA